MIYKNIRIKAYIITLKLKNETILLTHILFSNYFIFRIFFFSIRIVFFILTWLTLLFNLLLPSQFSWWCLLTCLLSTFASFATLVFACWFSCFHFCFNLFGGLQVFDVVLVIIFVFFFIVLLISLEIFIFCNEFV